MSDDIISSNLINVYFEFLKERKERLQEKKFLEEIIAKSFQTE